MMYSSVETALLYWEGIEVALWLTYRTLPRDSGSNPGQGNCVVFLGYDTLRSECLTQLTGINRHQPSEFNACENPAWTGFRAWDSSNRVFKQRRF